MMKFVPALLIALLVTGCAVSKPDPIVYKVKSVPVKLDSKFYEYPETPSPNILREEIKKLKPKEMIQWQTLYIHELLGHIGILVNVIDTAKKASEQEAAVIMKENE